MDPQVQLFLSKIIGIVLKSEITTPIDEVKLYWQIFLHLPILEKLLFLLMFLSPWIIGKYRINQRF